MVEAETEAFFGGGEEGLIVVGAIQRGDVIVDICPELRLRRTGGGGGFYNLRASAASQPRSAVEKHSPQFEL